MTRPETEDVVEEAVLLVPQLVGIDTDPVHSRCDVDEVLVELAGEVLVYRVLDGELQGDGQHVETEHRHPARPVRLLQRLPRRERRAAVEDADIVQAEESALEHVVPECVLLVDPPGEVHEELVELPLQEGPVTRPARGLLHDVHLPGGAAVNRRVHVTEVPLVGGDLSAGVQVHLVGDQLQLVLGEIEVDAGKDDAVKREIPGGKPRVFPLVGHRDDVGTLEVEPLPVAGRRAPLAVGRKDLLVEPFVHGVVIELLRPQHPRKRLAHHRAAVGGDLGGDDARVEGVGLTQAFL
jgi:hypothetical protein